MNTVYHVGQILKRFGTYIYTSNRLGDIELMESEVRELYKSGFITIEEYQQSLLILKREIRLINFKKGD